MKESEEKATQLLESLFSRQTDPASLVTHLKKLHTSNVQENKLVVDAVINNVFQEFKFLSQYPEPELMLISKLLAQCVNSMLMADSKLQELLSYAADCFTQPKDSKQYKFAIAFLGSLSSEAKDMPKVLSSFSKIPEAASILWSFGKSTFDKDTLLVHLNNITEMNVHEKASSVFGKLGARDVFWLIETCIQRSLKEPNYMNTYVLLFQDLGFEKFELLISRSIHEATKAFTSQVAQKNYYKNLGTWIGKLTLSLNRPILWKEMNLCQLFYNIKGEEEMKNAVVFTCNLLRQVKNSMFKPKNPWTMSIIVLLYSLCYAEGAPNTFKYEFELLLRSLKIPLSDVRSAQPPIYETSSDHVAYKSICLLSCLFILKENYDKIHARCIKISEDTFAVLLQKDRKYSTVQSLEVARRYTATSFLYMTCKEFLKEHGLEFIRAVFANLSLGLEETDILQHLIGAIDQIGAFVYLSDLPSISVDSGILPIARLFDSFAVLAGDIHCSDDEFLQKWWHATSMAVHEEIVNIVRSCGFQQVSSPSSSTTSHVEQLDDVVDKVISINFSDSSALSQFGSLQQQLINILSQHPWPESVILKTCHSLIEAAMKATSSAAAECLASAIGAIILIHGHCIEDCTSYILKHSTLEKLNHHSIRALIKQKVLPPVLLDICLAKYLESGMSKDGLVQVMKLVDGLISELSVPLFLSLECLSTQLSNPKSAEFHKSIEGMIAKASAMRQGPDAVFNINEWFIVSLSADSRYEDDFVASLFSKITSMESSELLMQLQVFVDEAFRIASEYAPYDEVSSHWIRSFSRLFSQLCLRSPRLTLFEAFLSFYGKHLLKHRGSSAQHALSSLKHILKILASTESSRPDLIQSYFSFMSLINPNAIPQIAIAWLDLLGTPVAVKALSENYANLSQSALNCLKEACVFLSCSDFANLAQGPKGLFYVGVLNIFVVIAHDIPMLFTEHFEVLLSKLPLDAKQLRNLVLSCVPKSVKLPDPFSIRLSSLDYSTEDRTSQELASSLAQYSPQYIKLVGNFDIALAHGLSLDQVAAVANYTCDNLRYPSKFTLRNIHLILSLYEHGNPQTKEAIVCVILERLVAHKPHPWGLMVAFLELIRNDRYKFWSEAFINQSSDIRNLFDSIAKTCLDYGSSG